MMPETSLVMHKQNLFKRTDTLKIDNHGSEVTVNKSVMCKHIHHAAKGLTIVAHLVHPRPFMFNVAGDTWCSQECLVNEWSFVICFIIGCIGVDDYSVYQGFHCIESKLCGVSTSNTTWESDDLPRVSVFVCSGLNFEGI